jgi:hypothetical protein
MKGRRTNMNDLTLESALNSWYWLKEKGKDENGRELSVLESAFAMAAENLGIVLRIEATMASDGDAREILTVLRTGERFPKELGHSEDTQPPEEAEEVFDALLLSPVSVVFGPPRLQLITEQKENDLFEELDGDHKRDLGLREGGE